MACRLQGERPEAAKREEMSERISMLATVNRILSEATSVEDAMPQLLQVVAEEMGWVAGAWWALDRPADVLRCACAWHTSPITDSPLLVTNLQLVLHRGEGPAGRAWATARPLWVSDIPQQPTSLRTSAMREDPRSALLFPALHQGEVVGVLEFHSHRHTPPDESLLTLVGTIGQQVGAFGRRVETEVALRRSEAIRTALLQAPLDAVVMTDHQGTVVEFNPAAESLFGYRRDQALGRRVFDLLVPPSRRDRNQAGLARHVVTGADGPLGRRIEGTAMRADGSTLPVEVTTVRLSVDGSPLFVGYVRDLSDRRKAEAARDLLAEVGLALAETQEPDAALERIARRSVPAFADFSVILLNDGGAMQRVALAHADPAKERLLADLTDGYRINEYVGRGDRSAAASGRPILDAEISEARLRAIADTPARLALLRELAPRSLMTVPLATGGRVIGALAFGLVGAGRAYTEDDVPLAEELGRRCALLIENHRLQHAERLARRGAWRAAVRMARLQSVTAALAQPMTPAEIANIVATSCAEAMGAQGATVVRRSNDGTTLEMLAGVRHPHEVVDPFRTFAITAPYPLAEAARTGRAVALEDPAAIRAGFPGFADIARDLGIESTCAIPLALDREVIGALSFSFSAPRRFDETDRAFLLSVGQQCALALERARLYEAERNARRASEQAAERMARLQAMTTELAVATTREEIADAIARAGMHTLSAVSGAVGLCSADGTTLEITTRSQTSPTPLWRYFRYPVSAARPSATVARTGAPLALEGPDIMRSQFPGFMETADEVGIQSTYLLPLAVNGQVIGTLAFGFAEPRRFDEADRALMLSVAQQCAVALDRVRLIEAERNARQSAEQSSERITRLQGMTAALAVATTIDDIAEAVATIGVDALGAISGAVGQRGPGGTTLEIVTHLRHSPTPTRRRRTIPVAAALPASEVARTGAPLALEELDAIRSQFPDFVERAGELGIQSTYLMPLVVRGEVGGTLAFGFGAPRRFGDADRSFMLSIAQQCAVALDRVRLYEAERDARRGAEQAAERLTRLQAVTASLALTKTSTEIADAVAMVCVGALGATSGSLAQLSADGTTLEVTTHRGQTAGFPRRYRTYPVTAALPVATVIRTGAPLALEDPGAIQSQFPAFVEIARELGIQSSYTMPLAVNGVVAGALAFSYGAPRHFDEADRAFMLSIAQQCTVALDRARSYEREMTGRIREEAERGRLTTLIETSPIGVVVLESADERISLMNQEARRVLGDPPERPQTLCQCEAAAAYRRPDGAPYDPKDYPWRRALHDGQTVRGEEVHFALGDGRVTPTLVSASPVRSADGTVFAAVVTIADFTARKDMETLQASVTALVSHEIRTPIHHIKGFASTLLQADVQWDEETQRDLLQRIEHETDRLTELVNDILEISRLESGPQYVEKRPLDLSELLDAGLETSSQFLAGRPLVVDAQAGLRVMGDTAQLERVIVNLLENAAKYTPTGTRIEVRARPRGAEVVMSVVDEGPGIPPADRERIFEKYVRLKDPRRKVPGTGLGLAICRVIVEGHGGRIWVEGEAGKGAAFCFTLPLAPDASHTLGGIP